MGKENADGYVRVKIDVDTSQEKEIKRSLEDIQDDADNAKRKLDALKETGVDENAKAYRKAAEDLEKYNKELDEYIRKQKRLPQQAGLKPPRPAILTVSVTGWRIMRRALECSATRAMAPVMGILMSCM